VNIFKRFSRGGGSRQRGFMSVKNMAMFALLGVILVMWTIWPIIRAKLDAKFGLFGGANQNQNTKETA